MIFLRSIAKIVQPISYPTFIVSILVCTNFNIWKGSRQWSCTVIIVGDGGITDGAGNFNYCRSPFLAGHASLTHKVTTKMMGTTRMHPALL